MTVYVSKLSGQSTALYGRTPTPDPWFALTADTDDELHAFAARLGLTSAMFQPPASARPGHAPVAGHYDVTLAERDRAVALGAQPIAAIAAGRMTQQLTGVPADRQRPTIRQRLNSFFRG